MKTTTTTIRQTVLVKNATPEQVYDAYMNSRKHAQFTGDSASISPKVGGKISAGSGYISGKNVRLVKGRLIVQEWKTTEWPDGYPPSRLALSLKKTKEGTEIKMVHSKVPASQAKRYRSGWQEFYWRPLKEYFKK